MTGSHEVIGSIPFTSTIKYLQAKDLQQIPWPVFIFSIDFCSQNAHATPMSITQGQLKKRGSTWHWRYRLDGVLKSRSLKTGDYREAVKIRQVLIAEYLERPEKFSQKVPRLTWAEVWAAYEPWSNDHKRRNTVALERSAWHRLAAFYPKKRPEAITSKDIERFKSALLNGDGDADPLKPGSINIHLRHLKAMWNQAAKMGLLTDKNPLKEIKQFKIQQGTPTFLTSDEVERLLEAAEKHSREMHWLFLLAIYAGLRKAEIGAARWEWMDFKRRVISVKPSESFKIKDNEERAIPMNERIHTALFPYAQPDGYLFDSGKPSKGKALYRYDPKRSFQAVIDAAKVPHAGYQIMRHTFGSALAQAGVSLFKVSKWMGHSSVNVTARHYAGLQSYDEDINRI